MPIDMVNGASVVTDRLSGLFQGDIAGVDPESMLSGGAFVSI